ncbi:DUF3078 domain-containing protein [Nemorincola caseinilytica]|uniref:DUF3078 domain-containing protein n=1 Tax=Nemorincola caseinilytica TaxID=2054315 RepID=A0ABP8NLK9_9BACT
MKKQLLFLFCLISSAPIFAQINKVDDVKKSLQTENKDTVAWVHSGVASIGINGGFLHNWAAGGELASLLVNGIFSGRLDRLNHRDIWSNNLDMTYGLIYNYSTGFVPRKTDDRIDFTSKYGMMLDTTNNIFLTGLFNFKSQFTKGYDYSLPKWDSMSTSAFFSPAFFTLALGLEYRKGSDISIFLSPAAARVITADRYYTLSNPEGMFGVPYGKTYAKQLGAYFSGRYTVNINKNMIYKTRLDLYSNYLAKDTKDSTGAVIKKDNPGNINVLFDNLFSWKVSKVFTITLGLTLMYDNNIPYSKTYIDDLGNEVPKNEPGADLGWMQIKQVATFGLGYKF